MLRTDSSNRARAGTYVMKMEAPPISPKSRSPTLPMEFIERRGRLGFLPFLKFYFAFASLYLVGGWKQDRNKVSEPCQMQETSDAKAPSSMPRNLDNAKTNFPAFSAFVDRYAGLWQVYAVLDWLAPTSFFTRLREIACLKFSHQTGSGPGQCGLGGPPQAHKAPASSWSSSPLNSSFTPTLALQSTFIHRISGRLAPSTWRAPASSIGMAPSNPRPSAVDPRTTVHKDHT